MSDLPCGLGAEDPDDVEDCDRIDRLLDGECMPEAELGDRWAMRVRVEPPPPLVLATPCTMDLFGELHPIGPPRIIDAMFATGSNLREREDIRKGKRHG